MADAKPPSTSDLIFLLVGLHLLKNPDTTATRAEDYYLNPQQGDNERTLRETKLNASYLDSPRAAWDQVRFRDWLTQKYFGEMAGKKQEFKAISEPVLFSKDLLAKSFTRDMKGVTDAIRAALLSKSQKERTFFSTLTFGISKQKVGNREIYLFGAGMRRRVQLFLVAEEALQVDVELFVPFTILPSSDHTANVLSATVRSFCAGIMISNSKDHALGTDDGKELVAMRFNLRIPFKAELVDETELRTEFGTPEINIEKRVRENSSPAPSKTWEKFPKYKEFLATFSEKPEIAELLNSPIGPLLPEKISDGSGVKDLILKQSKRDEIKTSLEKVKQDLDDTLSLLDSIWKWEPPDKKPGEPHSGSSKLGSLLTSLGFMTSKPEGADFKYTFKIASGLTAWNVVDRILDELDGYPLYASGLNPKNDKEKRIAVSLASQSNPADIATKYFGLAGLAYNILLKTISKKEAQVKKEAPDESFIFLSDDNFISDKSILADLDEDEEEEDVKEEEPAEVKEVSKAEVLLQLGKWFSNETLDDNWYSRLLPGKQRVPLPGIHVLPIKRQPTEDPTKSTFKWSVVIDLLSLGVDVRGTTKDGLTFLQGLAGFFGLGAVEVRVAIKLSLEDYYQKKGFFDRVVLGIGVKLKDLRLSLGPKEKDEKKEEKKDPLANIYQLLNDDWLPAPAPKPKRDIKTRLTAKKKDKFSLSVGYLSPLKPGSAGTLDVQLYDEKGVRGKLAVFPIDRSLGPLYLRQIGIGLKGAENLELSNGLPDTALLTVSLTGGIRFTGALELGLIGAKFIFQLNTPGKFKFEVDGYDFSFKIGSVIISGSFMEVGVEYAGSLTVSIPKGSFSAMGFYGSLILFDLKSEPDIVKQLNEGKLHKDVLKKLTDVKLTPATVPVRETKGGGWDLFTSDNNQFTIREKDDKLIVLRSDKTLFVYVTLSAASGTGITVGPIQFTAIVFGYGYNRRAKIPTIDNVAEFPLVKIVMGEGGYQHEDETRELHNQLAKPVDDPIAIFEKMKDYLVPELGQQFACGGARFTISGIVDCFALIVVQWGGGDLEISLLGLARFRQPRDLSKKAICYIEMQILMTIKPSEGTFKLQALLSENSWVINKDCKLTGGFAVFVWYDGKHKGDHVITLGGYHPRFRRPDHYPLVPRLGLNWRVNDNLSIKGNCYLAYTPSCGMLGARMEATFRSGRISAWFTAYLDVIINWSPIYFEADIGISLRVQASFFLGSVDITLSVSLKMWGPPVGGIAHIDLTVVSFDIPFGESRPAGAELVGSWQEFCHKFLNLQGGDNAATRDPVAAFPMVQPNLAAGRNNLNTLPNALRSQTAPKTDDQVWKVRADELELAAAATVPVMSLNVGTIDNKNGSDGIQARSTSGRSMMVTKAIKLESNGLRTQKSDSTLGIHPMGKGLGSVLNVTVIRDDGSQVEPVPMSDWTMNAERGALPAALWETGKPNLRISDPSAKLMEGCITGINRLKPPRGTLGQPAILPAFKWYPLKPGSVSGSAATQAKPAASSVRNVQPVMVQKQDEQKKIVDALASVGISLTWQAVRAEDVRFRELQSDPLTGAVAA